MGNGTKVELIVGVTEGVKGGYGGTVAFILLVGIPRVGVVCG